MQRTRGDLFNDTSIFRLSVTLPMVRIQILANIEEGMHNLANQSLNAGIRETAKQYAGVTSSDSN